MAINDIYRVVNSYEWIAPAGGGSNESCQNVYHYRQTGGSAVDAAPNLLSAFLGVVAAALGNTAPPNINFLSTTVTNLGNPADYSIYATPALGSRVVVGASWASPEANISCYNPRPFPGTRQARKSYPFLYRGELLGKNIDFTINGLDTLVNALLAALGANIGNAGNQFNPAVVRETSPGVFTYVWSPDNWFVKPFIGTQDTRRK